MATGSPVNWLFLAELVVVVIVTSAFLFYWNRLLGGAIAALIRIVSWRVFNVYVVIGSFQISPLAGRIAFRDVEYHSSNISFRALHGHITFRYWKFRVRQEGDTGSSNSKRARLPCRIAVNAEGVEAFFFNRTPAYDAIVERMKKHEQASEAGIDGSSAFDSARSSADGNGTGPRRRRTRPRSPETTSDSSNPPPKYPPIPEARAEPAPKIKTGINWLHETMPLELRIEQGSVVLGSDATPMVFITDFKRAEGTIEVSSARSACDQYKLSVNLGLQEVNVMMRSNLDYSGPLLAHGRRAYNELLTQEPDIAKELPSAISSYSGFHWLAKRFAFLYNPRLSAAPISGMPNDRLWKGLARYRLPDEKGGASNRHEERQYAKVTKILTTHGLDLTYYADTPGLVPEPGRASDVDLGDEIGNVEAPPEYGVDIVLHGGTVNYGPWADRQRIALQQAFAPSIFFDSEPKQRLRPGDWRVHTALIVNVSMTEKTTLRIPTREPSKDWMYDNKTDLERRYGWLDVVVGPNSSVTYNQAQVATKHGYDSMLMLHLDSLDIASSVNLQSFVVAKACKLSMTMPNPLVWNAQRNWGLDLSLDTPDIVLLREHVALISDLSRDWSSGAAGDYHHFVPMHYNFRLSMVKFALHLFINDFNVIDVPRSRDHNSFLDIVGPRLDAYVAVSSTRYKPEFSVIPFTLDAKDTRVELSLPSWDTHRSFGNPASMEVGKIGDMKVSGSYRYYSTNSPDHSEKLKLHVEADHVAYTALGWVVRRMFCVKDNYFGGFTQYSTMMEFLEKFDHSPDSVGDPIMEKYRPGRSDPFSVHLTVDVRDSLILMSDEIYSCTKGIAIPIPQLQLDLTTNELQMDMCLDISPTYTVACDDLEHSYENVSAPLVRNQDVVFVEGIVIKANRLFGPQPRATTYFCFWELQLSRVSAFLSPEFKTTLAAVGDAVGFNFTDHDNAPAEVYISQTPPDATLVKLSVDQATVLMSAGSSAIAIELPDGVFLDTSSMASKSCRSVLGLGLPTISVHLLQRRLHSKRWHPVGSVGTGVSADIYRIPKDWQDEAQEQQDFLRVQDEPTRRIPSMYCAPDDEAIGRHIHDVYAPIPRNPDAQWSESSSVGTYEEPEPGSSSAGTSDDTAPSVPISRVSRRKRALSIARTMETRHSSVGDESDNVSSTSTISTLSSDPNTPGVECDMPSILEERLQPLHKLQQRAKRLFTPREPRRSTSTSPNKQPPYVSLSIAHGAITRINLERTSVEISPETIRSAVDVVGAMGAAHTPPAIILDQLLTSQVSAAFKDTSNPGSKLFDVNVPDIDVRVVQGSFNNPESLIQCGLSGVTCRIVQAPVPDSEATSMDASVGVQVLKATVLKQGTPDQVSSLLDVPDIEIEPRHDRLLPFARVSMMDKGLTFHDEPKGKTVQLKSNDCSIWIATPGIPVISQLADEWINDLANLPTHKSRLTSAELIYDILQDAVKSGSILSLPAFMYHGSYGLHVQDQRNIRRDAGWFTLARLRHWFCNSKVDVAALPHPSGPEMAKAVVRQFCTLDESSGVNEEVVVNTLFMRKAFGKDLQEAGIAPRTDSSVSAFVGLETFAVNHYGRMLETGVIGVSTLRIESATVAAQKVVTWEDNVPSSHISTLVTVRHLAVDIRSSFLGAHQAVLEHVQAHSKDVEPTPEKPAPVETFDHTNAFVLDVHLSQLDVGLAAGGLRLDVSLEGAQGSTAVERSIRTFEGLRHVLAHDATLANCLALNATLREAPTSLRDADTTSERALVVTGIKGVRCSADVVEDSRDEKGGTSRLLLGVESFDFDSRPQLKAFYDFGQDWRKNHYPLYAPALEDLQAVIAKGKAKSSKGKDCTQGSAAKSVGPAKPDLSRKSILQSMMVDVYVGSVRLQARAAKGLWLGWDMGHVYVTRQGSTDHIQFGLRVEPQVVGAYTTAKRVRTKESSIIRLPSITATGTHRKVNGIPHLTAMVNLGMFTGILKPAVLDRLLSLHQRMGNDVVDVIHEYRGQKPDAPSKKPTPLVFRVQASVAGVRVGLRADDVPTTLMFEALELKGSATNADLTSLQWMAKANHVGLSLIRMADGPSYQTAQPLKGSRSVSMVFDITAQEIPGTDRKLSKLNISLSRVHTVMHVAALSEVTDLIRSWSSDISLLHDVHSAEVAEVKEQTTRVLKKLEATSVAATASNSSESAAPDSAMAIESWFASRLLSLEVTGFGIAIPLDEGASIDLDKRTGGGGPALLYSIRVISLTTSRNETARFRVQQTFLQFLDKFDPGTNEHFSGHFHNSSNRMVLPNIDSEAQMTSTPETWNVTAHCSATDFKLSLTPDIADGVARLIDLYEHGKAHLERMERDYRAEWAKRDNTDSLAVKYDAVETKPRGKQQVVVRLSLRFDSGVVELYRPSRPNERVASPAGYRGRKPDHHDTVTLPTVSVWMDYSGAAPNNPDDTAGTLLFNMAVHESRNVLRPTILPFFVELAQRIEVRTKTRSAQAAATKQDQAVEPENPPAPQASPSPPPETPLPITERAIESIAQAPTGKLRLRVTLRIDRSELRLSCAPDSNAYADLKWESGGFVASTLLGGKDTTTLAGSVSGVTAYLSHEFAEQNRGCIQAGAKDMAFSVTLCSTDPVQRGLSVVVDTQVSVQFRLEAFSAWLIFISVWVDNAPKFDLAMKNPDVPATAIVPATGASKLGVAALIRFRSVDFDANVAVSQARLEMTPIVLRTVTNGEKAEIDLNIGVTQVTAKGDISGDLRSNSLKFHTVRRSSRATVANDPSVLRMMIEGGDLHGNLFIGDMNIVRFNLEPSKVTLIDDWKSHALDSNNQVFLDFFVDAGKFSGVLRLPVIPRLLGHFYSMFDMVESQKRIASQRSEMFKNRRKRGEANATPMTTVVIPVGPKNAPVVPISHIKTAQAMRFKLKGIDIGIFSDDYEDGTTADFYRFLIGNISADLKREEGSSGQPLRELQLHVSCVEWQTSDGSRATRAEVHDMTAGNLITEAMRYGHRDVVVLPSMDLQMNSTELKDPRRVEYDFNLVWGPTDGDIKILPNFFEAAFKSFRKLLRGIDDQQLVRARRRGTVRASSISKSGKSDGEEPRTSQSVIQYHRRGSGPFNNPVPKLRALGETTGEAAMMVPRIKAAIAELPAYSHRFVTLPLEDGMNLLLGLYERQLPDIGA